MIESRIEHRWAIVAVPPGAVPSASDEPVDDVVPNERPKAFCTLDGERTLLEATLDRTRFYAPAAQTVLSVCHEHLPWRSVWSGRAVRESVQPRDAGTGPAVLLATLAVHRACANATVVLFPCDHAVSNDLRFISAVRTSALWVERHPEDTVLLGAWPDGSETCDDWLLPKSGSEANGLRPQPVRLIESPKRSEARRLLRGGALWNTGVVVCRTTQLLERCARRVPQWWRGLAGVCRPADLERVFAENPPFSLSRDVLQSIGARLHLLPLGDVRWSNLCTVEQIERERVRASAESGATCRQPDSANRAEQSVVGGGASHAN